MTKNYVILLVQSQQNVGLYPEDHKDIKILVDGNRYLAPRGEETELVEWHSIHTEIMQCASLIPNLRAIIPLMLCGIKDWVITDDYRSSTSGYHSLQLTLPTYCNAE